MGTCALCGSISPLVSGILGVCGDCIRSDFARAAEHLQAAHRSARRRFGLLAAPPRAPDGIQCTLCANECRMAPGERGYCGVRWNQGGHLAGADSGHGNVSWYFDPLPTNCVADWVCPGGTGAGYPRFASRPGAEQGYRNLAVFYQACPCDCLFCQNWHYRAHSTGAAEVDPESLAREVDERTACICYFGGDPAAQLPHALAASRLALAGARGRILRICWETSGLMAPQLLEEAAELSLRSGGCIKVDLKAASEELNRALCGVSNSRTLENIRLLAGYAARRPEPPLLVVSTLLVPGYVDVLEVSRIAACLSSIDPDIPYALLGFHPEFVMHDLPRTSRRHALECLSAARAQGLRNVRLGNEQLLGESY